MPDTKTILKTTARVIATLIVVVIAVVLGWMAWNHYVYSPWTRDARVQANVVNLAPEVSGSVTNVSVRDDSHVSRGDELFRIQPIRYRHNLEQAQASLKQAQAQREYAIREARRVENLPEGAVSVQELQQAQSEERKARAAVDQAKAELAEAKQDLEWSTVQSPVDGYVTHLLLNEGDYANQGDPLITLVAMDTFRTVAYFEETKIDKIHVGDPVDIKLMAGDTKLKGHVASIGYGIAVSNNAKGERNLPDVDPTFQWVRLAQRVPVTIAFDKPPEKLPLSVGMTATVHVHSKDKDDHEDRGKKAILRLREAQKNSQKGIDKARDKGQSVESTHHPRDDDNPGADKPESE